MSLKSGIFCRRTILAPLEQLFQRFLGITEEIFKIKKTDCFNLEDVIIDFRFTTSFIDKRVFE